MKPKFLLFSLVISFLSFIRVESQVQKSRSLDPSDIGKIASILTEAEPRQMGLLGFTALGALMFPILVSLGMASFVSHLPTVFQEFASEFGIPATPPRTFFFYRKKRAAIANAFEDRWRNILKGAHSNLIKKLEKRDISLNINQKL